MEKVVTDYCPECGKPVLIKVCVPDKPVEAGRLSISVETEVLNLDEHEDCFQDKRDCSIGMYGEDGVFDVLES